MKILHVAASLSPEWGGPVSVIKGLTEQLVRKSVEVTIFAPAKSDPSERIMRPEGTEVRLFDQDFLSRIWTVYSSDIAQALYQEASKGFSQNKFDF